MKDIPNYEWLYSISEDWKKVWSYPKWGSNKKWKFKKLAYKKYIRVHLSNNIKDKYFQVHRLVAMTSNLDWCTNLTNMRQAFADGLHPVTENLRNSMRITQKKAVLKSSKKVMQLTKEWILCRIYNSTNEAQRITGIWQQNIWKVALWKLKQTGWFIWKYVTI